MGDLEKRITAKMVLDDTGYSSTLKGINAELKNTKSEFKAASSSLEAFGHSTESVNRVQESLQKQLDLQSKKVDLYKQSIQKASETLEKNIAEREKLKQAMEQEENKLESLKRTYGSNNEAVKNCEERLDELQQAYNKADKSIENNAKRIQSYESSLNKAEDEVNKTTNSINKFNRELENVDGFKTTNKHLEETADKFDKIGTKMQGVGNKLSTHVSLPLAGVAIAAGKVGMDFESEMSRVQAISGATGEDFKKLELQALDLGASTSFSANECAKGMENLASAGFTTTETLAAMPGTLDAAASSGEELAIVTEIMTSTLRGFGLEAKESGHVADVLAKNASATNAAITDTGEAMKYIAPLAHAAGLSFEEVTSAIGLMSNAGIKGSQAGTTLRGALSRLADPSKEAKGVMEKLAFTAFDSSGKMLPLSDIISNLSKSTENLTDKQKQAAISTIFGQEAMSGMLALVDAGKPKMDELTNALKNSDGAAKDMATTMQDNTKASIEEAFGALETSGIKALKAAAPAIKEVAETVGELADKFSALSPETQEFIIKAGLVAIAAGPVINVVGGLVKGVSGLTRCFSTVTGALGLFGSASTATAAATAATGEAVAATSTVVATSATVATASIATIAGAVVGITAAVAAVGYAGYKTVEYLNQDAVPSVDLFADKVETSTERIELASGQMATTTKTNVTKISEATKQGVQSYLDLDKKATSSLLDLRINSDKFTKESKDAVLKNFTEMSQQSSNLTDEQRESMTVNFKKLVADTTSLTTKNKDEIIKQYAEMVKGSTALSEKQKNETIKDFTETLNKSTAITKTQSEELQKIYNDMGAKIKTEVDKKREEELKSQKAFFDKSNVLTVKEETEINQKTEKLWNDKKIKIDEIQNKINEIIKKASNEHRQLTENEAKTISDLQSQMKENAIKILSENEVQSKVILERMKDYSTDITQEMASEKIKELNKLRNESVSSANDECDKRIAAIIKMRDQSKVISSDQADNLIADAKRQKDETVQAAENTRNEAVEKIASMNSQILSNVNRTTGDVFTNWDKLAAWWDGWHPVTKFLDIITRKHGDTTEIDGNWTGNSNFKGGLTYLHERGYELYDLPSGSRIYNHESSEQMVLETARKTAEGVISSMTQNEGAGDIIIPINIAGEELDRIIVSRVSNRLALKSRGGR